jgi:hypothetical protein
VAAGVNLADDLTPSKAPNSHAWPDIDPGITLRDSGVKVTFHATSFETPSPEPVRVAKGAYARGVVDPGAIGDGEGTCLRPGSDPDRRWSAGLCRSDNQRL